MKLHLLRHAKTEPISATGKDYDRELLPKGNAQSKELKHYFSGLSETLKIYCSSAKRTRQTHDLSGLKMFKTDFLDELYLCSKNDIFEHLTKIDSSKKEVMIIGHNFGLSDIAAYLTEQVIELKTSEYLLLEFDINSWEEISFGTGTITSRYRPSPKSF